MIRQKLSGKKSDTENTSFELLSRMSSLYLLGLLLLAFLWTSDAWAVTSSIVRHSSSTDFLKGQIEDIVIGSKGTLQLGRAWETPVEEFEDVWSINSIVVNGATIFIGTSPNGGIFSYSLGELKKIYPGESEPENIESAAPDSNESSEPNDANTVDAEEHLANEHIFAMATDLAGRLIAGISGENCRLIRFEGDNPETIFEPNDAMYIFAIVTDDKGNIYMGTGPNGKIYRFDPFAPAATGLVYDSLDKNILSLAVGEDGFLYAGSDSRGLIYKIDPRNKSATVLYDSEQPEITALLSQGKSSLYAAATTAAAAQAESKFAAQFPMAGRPDVKSKTPKSSSEDQDARKLEIPITEGGDKGKSGEKKGPSIRPPKPSQASYIYRITEQGYVTEVFSASVVLFCLLPQDGNLLVGTGNSAQLFSVDPAAEQQAVIYEDKQASQITAAATSGDDVYLGTSNPAKLIKLRRALASHGSYTSDLVDAGQPANWGKLQIEADIPQGCTITLSSRSGNVRDVNDPTFSDWTEPIEITGPTQLRCPLGRFCQYKLTLKSPGGAKSPTVREIAIAHTVPNLAPKVESVNVSRVKAAGKTGVFKISYKGKDDNDDELVYKIDFRKLGRTNWIELKDKVDADTFEWDGKTVEDGRYEVKVTASDEKDNTTATKLTGSRISDTVIVDNTGPVVKEHKLEKAQKTATLKLVVVDELSAIGKVDYTVDSNAEWKGAIPDDLVFDTTQENLTIVVDDIEAGEHIITIRVRDQVGNTTYKSFEIAISGN